MQESWTDDSGNETSLSFYSSDYAILHDVMTKYAVYYIKNVYVQKVH
jgi:hypothetical protein